MTTEKEYCNFILEKIDLPDEVAARPMMGEYLLYYRRVLIGGIYDGQLLVKETPRNTARHLRSVVPYEGAKRTMYVIENLNDKAKVQAIIKDAYEELLPTAKKK